MKRRGFSLAELMVLVVIFSLFSTTLAGVLKLSLSYWGRTNSFMLAQQNARIAMSTICTEFRQAMHPSTQSSDIVVPSTDGGAASQFEFLEASPAFQPLLSPPVFSSSDDPSHYQQINYSILHGVLNREVQTFNSSGGIVSDTTQALVATHSGSLSVTVVVRLGPDTADVKIISTEGSFAYVLETQTLTAVMH